MTPTSFHCLGGLTARAIMLGVALIPIVSSPGVSQGAPGDLDEPNLARLEKVVSELVQISFGEREKQALRLAVTDQWRVTSAQEKARFLPNLATLEKILSNPNPQTRRQASAVFLQTVRAEPDKPLHRFVLSLLNRAQEKPPSPQVPSVRGASQSPAFAGTSRPVPGALDGLYVGARARPRIGAIGTDIVPDYVLFTPDGRFFNGKPRITESGELDFARSAQEASRSAGTYRAQGATLYVRFATRDKEYPWDLEKKDGEVVIRKQGFSFYRRRPAKDLRLDGQYRFGLAQTSTSGGLRESAQTFHEKTVKFSKDGRFVMSAMAAMTLISDRSGPSRAQAGAHSVATPKTGRYKINNYAIDLTFDDGTTDRKPFVLPDDSLRTINIAGVAYHRID